MGGRCEDSGTGAVVSGKCGQNWNPTSSDESVLGFAPLTTSQSAQLSVVLKCHTQSYAVQSELPEGTFHFPHF